MSNRRTISSFEFGPFRLDLSEQVLLRQGRKVRLTPKVFAVLRVLVENAGHLVDKETLMQAVWADSFVEEGALNRSVSVLRKALGDTASEPQYIETVPKRGYRFVTVVTESPGGLQTVVEPKTRVRTLRWTAAVTAAFLATAAAWYAAVGSSAPTHPRSPYPADHRQVTFTGRAGSPTLSDDGLRVAYVSDDAGEKKVMVQTLAGGAPIAVFSAPEVGHLRWSPDATELVLWARGAGKNGVYVISHLGGTPRSIVQNQYVACWSPDGSTIAVGSYLHGRIRFFDPDAAPLRTIELKDVTGSIWGLDWSRAHDRLVVVTSDEQGRYSIWTVRPNGEEQRRLLVSDTEVPAARWSPGGDAIYYFRRLNQTASLDKLAVQKDGSGDGTVTTLISGLETDRSFAMSGDATRLVYARAPYYSNLWMLDRAGGRNGPHTTELTHGTSLIERPRLSPDGTSIIFNMGQQPIAHLYTMSIAGGSPRQLTFGESFNVGGSWSPDGRRIAFASTEGGIARIWTVNADGGSPRAISSGQMSENLDLTWFPGSRILYQQAGNGNYYELNPATGEEGFITKPSTGWMFSPAYSPDGRKIALAWNRPPHNGIWTIDTRDGRGTLIYQARATSAMPLGWSANGTSIYAVEGKPGVLRGPTLPLGETTIDARIVEVLANGGGVRPVVAFPHQEIGSVTMTPDALRFFYTAYTARSDVWVVDNFDASSNRNGRPRTTR